MFSLAVLNTAGEQVGTVELDKSVFDGKVNKALLHQVMLMYRANQRQGTANTKTRAEVSGGNSKPWRQKGTGRARAGSSRSPLWRKGGIVFGPHPRDYSYRLPKKMKTRALIDSINSRLNDNGVKIISQLKVDSHKTKNFVKIIKALGAARRTLFVCENPDESLLRSSRNIPGVGLKRWETINALDVLLCRNLIFTDKALAGLTGRLKRGV